MSTDTLTRTRRWSSTAHEVVELEVACAYAAGYEAGRADQRADLEEWAADFAASAPGAHHMPVGEAAIRIVQDLVARMTAEARRSLPTPTIAYEDEPWPRPARPGGAR